MLAKIITLLPALGVSAAGVAAISTATNHIGQVNTPTHANGPPVTDRLAMAKQHAAAAAANGLARAQAAKANGTHDTTGKPLVPGQHVPRRRSPPPWTRRPSPPTTV